MMSHALVKTLQRFLGQNPLLSPSVLRKCNGGAVQEGSCEVYTTDKDHAFIKMLRIREHLVLPGLAYSPAAGVQQLWNLRCLQWPHLQSLELSMFLYPSGLPTMLPIQ